MLLKIFPKQYFILGLIKHTLKMLLTAPLNLLYYKSSNKKIFTIPKFKYNHTKPTDNITMVLNSVIFFSFIDTIHSLILSSALVRTEKNIPFT